MLESNYIPYVPTFSLTKVIKNFTSAAVKYVAKLRGFDRYMPSKNNHGPYLLLTNKNLKGKVASIRVNKLEKRSKTPKFYIFLFV